MPPTTENIPDKPEFDVYGSLLILTFLFTGVASWLLYDDLCTNWGYGREPRPEKAVHLTRYNVKLDTDMANLSQQDVEEWKLAAKAQTGDEQVFCEPRWEWPAGYNPEAYPIKDEDNWKLAGEDPAYRSALQALIANYKPETESPAPAPTAPAPTPPNATETPAPQ